jgi:hypothetical protein
MHPHGMTLQQQPTQNTGGSITSGYPIRTTASYQRPPSPHVVYSGQRMTSYGAPRYNLPPTSMPMQRD